MAVWDNARFLAITLVVIGHALTKMVGQSDTAFVLYLAIYLFHIPLFVLLAGFFASAEAPTGKRIQSIVTDLVLPYLIFEMIWSVIQSIQGGEFLFNPLRPSWTLWFLLSLIAWRILLPYLAQLPAPLVIAIVVSVWSGYWAVDQTLSLSRTLGFVPFFVLGWMLRQGDIASWWMALPTRVVTGIRLVAGALFMGLIVTLTLAEEWLRSVNLRLLLTFDQGYAEAGFDQWWIGGVRLALMVVAFVLSLAFLALAPRQQTWFTAYGQTTMTVYLLHTFVLAPLRGSGILAGDQPPWFVGLAVVGAIALTILLAHPSLTRLMTPLIRPTWALSRREKGPTIP